MNKLDDIPAGVQFPDSYRCGQLTALLEIEQRKSERLQAEIDRLRLENNRLREELSEVAFAR